MSGITRCRRSRTRSSEAEETLVSRVLVVEDESAIAELVALNLRHSGYEVTVAATADEAQAAVDRVLPDLVLLD
jgi:two-component system phosphate regulon response regulator PhoB